MTMTSKRVLVVDDDPEILSYIQEVSEQLGFKVSVANDSVEFKARYAAGIPDLIVMDIVMPGEDGIELMRFLAEKKSPSKLIIMSGYNPLYLRSGETLARDWGLAAIAVLTKPFELDTLEAALLAA
jgi:CheY-like chemotaxis protein